MEQISKKEYLRFLLALDMHKQEETAMFFDIGTNGELVIGNRHWLLAGAGAAGPALEGYISKFGMRAAPGAIDTVRIRGEELTFTTIDKKKPVGICGSGILDLLAQMRRNGWINVAGILEPEAAITVGMYPDLPREKYTVLKNSSLDGARTVLLDRHRVAEAGQLAESIYCVQFASIPDFLVRMQAAKFVPHTDRSRFPSVQF